MNQLLRNILHNKTLHLPLKRLSRFTSTAAPQTVILLQKVTVQHRIQKYEQWNANGKANVFRFMSFPIHRNPDTQRTTDKSEQKQRSFRCAIPPLLSTTLVIRHHQICHNINKNKPYDKSGLHIRLCGPPVPGHFPASIIIPRQADDQRGQRAAIWAQLFFLLSRLLSLFTSLRTPCYRFTLLPAIPDKATTPAWEYRSDSAPVWLLSRGLRQCFLHECCPCSADYYVSPACYAASEAHLLRLRCLKRGKLIRKGCTCIAIYKAELFIYTLFSH